MWEAIPYVTSGLALVAFVAAAVTWLLKSKADSVEGLIARANKKNLPGILETYLDVVKVDTTGMSDEAKKAIALEKIRASSRRYRQNAIVICIVALLVAMVAGLSILQANANLTDVPAMSKNADRLRIVVPVVMFGIKDGQPYALARMSIANTTSDVLLINHIGFGVVATSRTDGTALTKSFDLMSNRTLAKDAIEALELENTPVIEWSLMGKPTSQRPAFGPHFFTFWAQVQATVASSGQTIMLDINMPHTRQMPCDHECVAVYELNVPAGAASYKKCSALQAPTGWTLDCVTSEDA